MPTFTRGLRGALLRSLQQFPVAVLEGGRAVGKSTLCRMVAAEQGWSAPIDLSEPNALSQLRVDPLRYLRELTTPAIFDEAQLEPQLPLWVKRVVDDRGGRPGQFLLTGSARLGRTQLGGSDPLAGRAARFRMWPLTASERSGQAIPLAAELFRSPVFEPGRPTQADGSDWLRGGLPGIPGVLTPANAAIWERAMSAYVESVIPLGIGNSRVDQSRLLRAFRYLGANPGQQLSFARMSNELGIKSDTARAYLDHLEASFLLFRAESQRPSEHKVLTAHPRVFCTDVGLACWAMRLGDQQPNALQRGSLLENSVALALASTTDWADEQIQVRHWRDRKAQLEVDQLLVHPNGKTIAIEVKAAENVGPADTLGIQAYAHANRESFHRAFVVYCGTRVVDLTPSGLPDRTVLAVPLEFFARGATPAPYLPSTAPLS